MKITGLQKQRQFFPNTFKGVFLSRPNRFIVECVLSNKIVRAYLPNPGRLCELLFPGSIMYLIKHDDNYKGSTDYTAVAVERDGIPVMLHTHVNNLVAAQLIKENKIPGLECAEIVRPEITIGHSRFDFLIKNAMGRDVVVEIKSCTLVGNTIAMFPDAITARGTKHLLALANLTERGIETAVVFIVHWPKARFFMPEHHTDLEFSKTLLSVKDSVLVKAISVEWKEWLSRGIVRELTIPWGLVEQEAHDSGSYLIILSLKNDHQVSIGGMGEVRINKGYYLYVGSAKTYLTQRIERHRRCSKRHHWHIDYLRSVADFHTALPVRSSVDLECDIAKSLEKIADWNVKGFGSSDCNCETHLFGMAEDPMHCRSFINLLQYYRIDRLEQYLTL